MKKGVKLKFRASQSVPGSGTLVIRVIRHRVSTTTSTSCFLSSDEWDDKKQTVLFPESASSVRKKELTAINRQLKKDMKDLSETVDLLESRGDYTAHELVRRFRERQRGNMFCAYISRIEERLVSENRFGTAHAYHSAKADFLKFLDNRDIHIDKINAVLMEDYERYLLSRNKSKNTVSCYMRSLRAAYNRAVREKIFTAKRTNENPFSYVFTGNAKTTKRAIDSTSISKLMKAEIPGNGRNSQKLFFFRDLFMFSFFTHGMSFSDMAELTKKNFAGGCIRYKRKKTGQLITVELEDCMKTIIDRYRDDRSQYIFPILRDFEESEGSGYGKWKKTAYVLADYNRGLKKLAGLAGIEEHLTSYVSRHSWATMASREGIPVATISRGMGHESEKTTRIYISGADYSDVGLANRRILSHFTGKKHIPPLPAGTMRAPLPLWSQQPQYRQSRFV